MVAVPATPPPFIARVERVTAADLPYSWHSGCPVSPAQLRRLRLAYVGFDGKRHLGALVVNARVVPRVVVVFRTLYRARFAGFSSKEAARSACTYLSGQKISCLAVSN